MLKELFRALVNLIIVTARKTVKSKLFNNTINSTIALKKQLFLQLSTQLSVPALSSIFNKILDTISKFDGHAYLTP